MDLIEARNNLFAIILLYATIHLPISIIIMRSYFESLPVALEEAAMIDGCNRIKVFFYVALPLAKVAIATIAIINVVGIWSEFLFASVLLTQPDARTLPIAIATLGVGQAADYGLRFAGLSLATIPMLLVYFLFSKKIVKGVMAGSVK
ncbi:sugar ABC transporter permease [Halalkalibacter wakoensis JCM 9140]|uniref:Sugar ABC transporter permease n=2 Tax=Halalkalibacter wakoensis TaxID=127891 RepID=W4Q7L6_9BACI|nr:sugar ABC transporter permease [Halalkalibacter wakoensis JCM 9140]